VDGQVDCLTSDAFPAVLKTTIVAKAGQYRLTLSLAGVPGTLGECASDNGIDCLTTVEHPSVIKNLVLPSIIQSGKVIAGVTGTFAPLCTADGQADCITTDDYPGAQISGLTPFDLRVGKTIGGVVAKMVFNRNASDTAVFNRTSGSGAVASAATVDAYDSLDDYSNGNAFPTAKVSGWPALSSNFVRDSASDSDADGTCNGTEECVLRDLNSRVSFAKASNVNIAWEGAISACESLSYGTYTDWRLPTQKEVAQAYIDGIYAQRLALSLLNAIYHTATTLGLDSTRSYTVNPATGEVSTSLKSGSAYTLCVR
jgi:hypothetical protein